MPELKAMIGHTILALVPFMHRTDLQELKLHGVEGGGIWVESQNFTNQLLAQSKVAAAPKTPVVFLPYHQITAIFHALDEPSLSEKAFGVED